MTVRFRVQPSDVVAGASIRPTVEVEVQGGSASATVSLVVADNLCGANLSGGSSRAPVNGVASFPDLSINLPADEYRLEARVLESQATSAGFDVAPPPRTGPVELLPFVCARPNVHGDAAALAWVPAQDLFWLSDDNFEQIFSLDRRTGAYVSAYEQADFLEAFPDAANCDDGDGDPATRCSYTAELEVVAFDDLNRDLYVFNTVNTPGTVPPVDRPAVYRLGMGSCRGCLVFEAWKGLPEEYSYRTAVAIEGEIYISNQVGLHRYDWPSNTVDPERAITAPHTITGLGYRAGVLYVLTRARTLVLYDWETRAALGTYDLVPTGLISPAGLEAVRDTVYVVEGEPENPILALKLHPDEE